MGPDLAPPAINLGSAIRRAEGPRWFRLVNFEGSLSLIGWNAEPGWLLVTYRRMKELRVAALCYQFGIVFLIGDAPSVRDYATGHTGF